MGFSPPNSAANRDAASSVEAQGGCDQQKASIEAATNGCLPLESHAFEASLAFGMQDELDGSAVDHLSPPIPGPDCDIFTYKDDNIIPSTLPTNLTRPYLLVNIGSGVSFFQVFDNRRCERITGSSFGGSALCGLLLLLTKARTFDEMLELADKGDNSNVDKLIGDIYGVDYTRIGMKMTAVASTFCKAFSKEPRSQYHLSRTTTDDDATQTSSKPPFSDSDICHSLVFALFNNVGQLATLQSRVHENADIYFTGPYVRGHPLIIRTLCIAVRYYSGGEKRAHVVSDPSFTGGDA
ncbi:hypothetical protein CDV36_009969 [Fusarium kuroshium]|uniref:Pantothenate kinase n=1 Tax=Fusarium kuroshium TaxID=2010991 RepID=A0A3M2RYQ0_9HYPO|nr:hypothetical protein CDV36_009969 [Fusarium kuroshium]